MSRLWRELEARCDRYREKLAIPHTESGDYVGCLEYRSNARLLLEDYAAGQLGILREYVGGYGSSWLTIERSDVLSALRAAKVLDARREIVDALRELVDVLDELDEYPVLSEDDAGGLVAEALAEFVSDWLRWDAPESVREMSDEQRDELAGKLAWETAVWDGLVHENCTVYVRDADMLSALRALGVTG